MKNLVHGLRRVWHACIEPPFQRRRIRSPGHGAAYSDHTGPGTIRDGKWDDGKLSFTLDFNKHESIVVSGVLKEGKLAGEFSTEGFTDKWEATKKK
jgi:hypothetical protein